MENTKLDDHGETPTKKTVVLRVIDEELHVSASEDLNQVYVAGMLYKALQALSFMMDELDTSDKRVLQ